mgnify:CR=1 FL=1
MRGKSTTLKSISGLLLPERGEVTRGDIRFMGRDIAGLAPQARVKMGIVQVLEGRRVFEHLTPDENLVAASAQAIAGADGPLQLIVPPEGTRSKTRYWKTGFYYIAQTAQVPIVMAYMDYATKRSGLGPLFQPTGDIEADMAAIKAFYAPFKGKNAAQFEAEPIE